MRIAAILRATASAWCVALALTTRARAGAALLDVPVFGDGGLFDQIYLAKQ